MAKIGVNVDSFVEILTFYPKAFPALGKLISLLDLEGASSINASLVSGQKGYSLKMLEFVQKLYGGLLNVYTDIDSNNIQQVFADAANHANRYRWFPENQVSTTCRYSALW